MSERRHGRSGIAVPGVRKKFIVGRSLLANEVGMPVYTGFVPRALAEGRYIADPDALVV